MDGGFFCYPRLLSDSSMDVVRETAAFEDVMAHAKARHDAFRQTRDRVSDRAVTRLDDAR